MGRLSLPAKVIATGVFLGMSSSSAASIFVTELFGISDPNAGPGGSTTAAAINDSNQVAGYYETNIGYEGGFVYSGGIYNDIAFPGAILTTVTGINDRGQVVGEYATSDGQSVNTFGFLYSEGAYTTLNLPYPVTMGGVTGLRVNDSGQIIGSYQDANGVNHGYIYNLATSSVTQSIDVPGALQESGLGTVATGIDNNGDVVGYYVGPTCCLTNGFLLRNGVYSTIETGGFDSVPLGINDQGDIVGYNIFDPLAIGYDQAFFSTEFGVVAYNEVFLLPPNVLLDEALATNDNGDLLVDGSVSVACCSATQSSPEPSSGPLLLSASFVLLAWWSRRMFRV